MYSGLYGDPRPMFTGRDVSGRRERKGVDLQASCIARKKILPAGAGVVNK